MSIRRTITSPLARFATAIVVGAFALPLVRVRGGGHAPEPRTAFAQPASRFITTPSLPPGVVVGIPTRVTMRNVDFHVAEGVVLHIHRLEGEMRALGGGVVDFDEPKSYVTILQSAEVALRGSDLTTLMNHHVFAYPGAPLRRLRMELQEGRVRQTGILHKGVDIPSDIIAVPSLERDGRIRLHPTRIRIFGVNGQALMRALGLDLEKMIDASQALGIAVDGNDLLIDATAILPVLLAVRRARDERSGRQPPRHRTREVRILPEQAESF